MAKKKFEPPLKIITPTGVRAAIKKANEAALNRDYEAAASIEDTMLLDVLHTIERGIPGSSDWDTAFQTARKLARAALKFNPLNTPRYRS